MWQNHLGETRQSGKLGQLSRLLPQKNLLDFSGGFAWWCNGSTSDSGSLSPGSNPGRAMKNDETPCLTGGFVFLWLSLSRVVAPQLVAEEEPRPGRAALAVRKLRRGYSLRGIS